MDLTERTVESKTLFEGKIIKVTLDVAELPDGTLANREVVYHPGGVAILALDENNQVPLVRQFRYPLQQLLLELPAHAGRLLWQNGFPGADGEGLPMAAGNGISGHFRRSPAAVALLLHGHQLVL